MLGKGRNCSELFSSYHSLTDKPNAVLRKFYVEDAQPGDADYDDRFDWDAAKTPFYTELKTEVRRFFAERQLSHKASWGKLAVVLGCAVLAAVVYWKALLQGQWWAAFVLPWLYWLGPACMLHDGTHWALSGRPWVNRTLAQLGCLHMGVYAWLHQHVVGHHSYTNELHRDPDLHAFEGSGEEGALYGHRLSPFAPYFGLYRRWLRSLFITVPFSCLQPTLQQDTAVWLRHAYDRTVAVTTPPSRRAAVVHLAWRTLLWSILFGVPFALWGLSWKAAFFAFYMPLQYGLQYYVFSQISHINEDCFQVTPSRDWARHQVQTSLDWGVHHSFWRYLSIALNLQAIHHLFPQVDSSHHMQLRPIVERVAAKHGIKLKSSRYTYGGTSKLRGAGPLRIRPEVS